MTSENRQKITAGFFFFTVFVSCVMAFQNCGGFQGLSASAGSPATTFNSKQVGLVETTTPGSGQITSVVIPQTIDFSAVNQGFFLDVNNGAVRDTGGHTIYQISAQEQTQLDGIFNGSVYANVPQIFALQGKMPPPTCTLPNPVDYAVIETNVAPIHLQGASCNEFELFNMTSFQPAGLEQFLSILSSEIAGLCHSGYALQNGTCVAIPLAFVFTGESNSGGKGLNSDATASELAPQPSVKIMNLTSGLFGFENLLIGTNNLRDHAGLEAGYNLWHGFELELANLAEANMFPGNPSVYLIKTGQGGSTVNQWDVGGASGYWTKFLQRTNAGKSQLPGNTQWVVWMSLGINDAIAGTPIDAWKAAMEAHISKIKIQLPGAIIILTRFDSMPGAYLAPYNAAIDQMASELSNVSIVDSTGAAIFDDGYHWNYSGLKTVADRMAALTKQVLHL